MENHDYGYLFHGKAGEPMFTEKVRVRNLFGDNWEARFEGRWRKVHIQLKKNYIVYNKAKITIDIEGV